MLQPFRFQTSLSAPLNLQVTQMLWGWLITKYPCFPFFFFLTAGSKWSGFHLYQVPRGLPVWNSLVWRLKGETWYWDPRIPSFWFAFSLYQLRYHRGCQRPEASWWKQSQFGIRTSNPWLVLLLWGWGSPRDVPCFGSLGHLTFCIFLHAVVFHRDFYFLVICNYFMPLYTLKVAVGSEFQVVIYNT